MKRIGILTAGGDTPALPIFSNAIGNEAAEHMRQTLFDAGHLTQPYQFLNTDVNKRIRYLEGAA